MNWLSLIDILPLPDDAICKGRVGITLMIIRSDAPPRPPDAEEVRGVRVVANDEAQQ